MTVTAESRRWTKRELREGWDAPFGWPPRSPVLMTVFAVSSLGASAADRMSPRASVGDFAAQMRAATVNTNSTPTVSLGEMVATAASRTTGITALTNPTSLVALNASSVASGRGAGWKSVAVDGGIPPELAKYGNGRIPTGELESIGIGEHRMWSPAAEAFTAMRTAAAGAGVTIGVTDSYRNYDQQVDLARRKGLCKDDGVGRRARARANTAGVGRSTWT